MAGPNDILSKGFIVDTPIPKFYAVKLSGKENVSVVDTAGELTEGICQEEIVQQDVDDGRKAAVRVLGISNCIAGAAITQGDEVTVAADGRVITAVAASGNRVLGIAQNAAAAAGDWVPVLLTPAGRVA